MLTEKEEKWLRQIATSQNATDAVEFIVKEYSENGVDNALHLLNLIPKISEILVKKVSNVARNYSQAAFWLMCQREMEDDKDGTLFASMVPVCMAMFPSGNADGKSNAEKKYFEQFLHLLSDKKQFSWEKDKSWADMFGYTDYLRLVEKEARTRTKV